jgi:hypothetical protein
MDGELLSGLIMLGFLGITIGVILAKSEANKKRQDDEFDKIKEEYDKVQESKNKEVN